jgi:hypothetical protein
MKTRKMAHFYMEPKIRVFESLNELNISKLGEVANQQERDLVIATILCGLWMSTISRTSLERVDYSDGRVLQVLEHFLPRFVLSCLKGKRECSYEALMNWAYEMRRSNKGLNWKGNMNKACKVLWKALPKYLKKGAAFANGSIVYSTL